MLGIIALALIVVAALIVFSFAVHVLFSPWLLLVALAAPTGSVGPRPPAAI